MKHIDVPEARHHWVLKAVAMLQHAGRLRVKQEGHVACTRATTTLRGACNSSD